MNESNHVFVDAIVLLRKHEKKIELMKSVLHELAEALPKDKDTVRTCYAITNIHRNRIHEVLAEIENI